jgi:hypothetical protein
MDYLKSIEQLLASKKAENNYLAVQLMMTILHYSFEEAYAKLQPANENDQLVSLEIAELHVNYKVDLQRIIYAPSSYADIERTIIYKDKVLPNSTQKLFADDDSILSLGEFGPVEDLKEIRDDLASLCPYMEALYEQMLDS